MSDIRERLVSVVNARPVLMTPVQGGYTAARRLTVEFSNSLSAFVKVATDPATAGWLRDEYRIYKNVQADFMPQLLGWHDDGVRPLIVLQDLSAGLWPRTWTREMIAAVLETMDGVRQVAPPVGLPELESMRHDFASWHLVAAQPQQFLSLGLCSDAWLRNALPIFVQCESEAVIAGSELLHLDLRSDNICFLDNKVLLVDWNWASVGNGRLDLLFWLPSLACEGGPLPEQVLEGEPNLVALIAGFWAYRAGMPPPHPGSDVRDLQRRQLVIALAWSARLLALPPPDGAS
jgi:hypothetical protein